MNEWVECPRYEKCKEHLEEVAISKTADNRLACENCDMFKCYLQGFKDGANEVVRKLNEKIAKGFLFE